MNVQRHHNMNSTRTMSHTPSPLRQSTSNAGALGSSTLSKRAFLSPLSPTLLSKQMTGSKRKRTIIPTTPLTQRRLIFSKLTIAQGDLHPRSFANTKTSARSLLDSTPLQVIQEEQSTDDALETIDRSPSRVHLPQISDDGALGSSTLSTRAFLSPISPTLLSKQTTNSKSKRTIVPTTPLTQRRLIFSKLSIALGDLHPHSFANTKTPTRSLLDSTRLQVIQEEKSTNDTLATIDRSPSHLPQITVFKRKRQAESCMPQPQLISPRFSIARGDFHPNSIANNDVAETPSFLGHDSIPLSNLQEEQSTDLIGAKFGQLLTQRNSLPTSRFAHVFRIQIPEDNEIDA